MGTRVVISKMDAGGEPIADVVVRLTKPVDEVPAKDLDAAIRKALDRPHLDPHEEEPSWR